MRYLSIAAVGLNDRLALAVGLLVFLLTYWLAPYYFGGDQIGYRAAYSIGAGTGLRDARELYELRVSGSDYFHFFLVWIASNLEVSKNVLMSVANGFLAAYTWKLFCEWGADGRIAAAIVLTNFYMLVMYFAAERLKFGMLFLMLSLISIRSYRQSTIFAVLAAISHVTPLGVGISFWIKDMALGLRTKWDFRQSCWIAGAAIVIFGMMFLERAMLLGKWNTYISSRPAFHVWDVTPALLMLAGAIYYSRQLCDPLLRMGPLLVTICFLGGSRLNMLLYFIFLYYALRVRGGFNVGVLATGVYLGWKSVLFIQNVLRHGDGFAV